LRGHEGGEHFDDSGAPVPDYTYPSHPPCKKNAFMDAGGNGMTWTSLISLCLSDRSRTSRIFTQLSITNMESSSYADRMEQDDIVTHEDQTEATDVELMEALSNQFEHDLDFNYYAQKHVTEHSCSGSNQGANFDNEVTECDFSPSLRFTFRLPEEKFEELEKAAISSDDSNLSKPRQLRLVHGRLQVVGFPADLPEITKPTKPLKPVKKREPSNSFWGEVINYLMQ
jgi:hypothetical protein